MNRKPLLANMDFLLPGVVVLSLIALGRCQDPEIVNDILPEVKRVGMTGMLNCTVARLGDNSVQWAFKGQTVSEIISINLNIQVLNPRKGGIPVYEVILTDEPGDRSTFSLVISRLRPEFSGQYECAIQVTNKDPSLWARKTGYLTVQQPPMIKPGSTDSVKMIEKGDNASITCDAFGVPYPNITWVRSDGKLLPNGKAIFRGKTLPIDYADVIYAGVYRCVADNSIRPPAESLTQVYVFQAPSVRVLQDSVGQFANGRLEAKLDCIVQGYPIPTVYWMVMSGDARQRLLNTEKYETTKQATDMQNLFAGEQWYTLTIKFVQAGDFKDYFCVGSNSKGESMAKVTLFSTWDCQGPMCYSLDPENRGDGHRLTWCLPLLAAAVVAVAYTTLSGH